MTGASVGLRGIELRLGARTILAVDGLELPGGRTTAVLGRNGAGKSTLLRVAGGLRAPTRGEIRLDGRRAAAAELRGISAAVLQRPLLARGTVRRNAELGLRFRGVAARAARERAEKWLDRFGVLALAGERVDRLSGGEAQRVSLARALALEPRLLLLDEPFGPLDAPTRGRLLGELRALLADAPTTVLLVTHDAGEAALLGERLVLLEAGRVGQQGDTADVLRAPANAASARLLGYDNVLEPATAAALGIATAVPLACRAADLEVTPGGAGAQARVRHSYPLAGALRVHAELGGRELLGTCHALTGLAAGTPVALALPAGRWVPVSAAGR